MERDGEILLEGAFLAERARSAGLAIVDVACVPAREVWARATFAQDATASDLVRILPERELAEIAGYPFHRGVLVRARRPEAISPGQALDAGILPARSRVLVLPELVDPENLGSCFRNAAALGCGAVLIGPKVPDPFSRRVLRVSMGASLSFPWARLSDDPQETFSALRARGFRTAACVLDRQAIDLRRYEAPERLALVLGNEASGLSAPWLEPCDDRLTLPMYGDTDSLNLATAAALFLYALSGRQ
ncbi:MAG: RNA methyltransferase [Rectinema sp.]